MISSIYFDKLTDELETVLEELGNDLYGQLDQKLSTRKQTDLAMVDQLKDKLSKTKSRSRIEVPGASNGSRDSNNQVSYVHVHVHVRLTSR